MCVTDQLWRQDETQWSSYRSSKSVAHAEVTFSILERLCISSSVQSFSNNKLVGSYKEMTQFPNQIDVQRRCCCSAQQPSHTFAAKMAHLFHKIDVISQWFEERRQFYPENWIEEVQQKLNKSTTLYVGNLSFHTTEEQIYEFFSLTGVVKRVIMGLNKQTKEPCGFCFVE